MTRIASILAKNEYEYKAIRQLGINILVRAAQDAFVDDVAMCQKKHAKLFKDDAINFLTGKFPLDLKIVCDIAGVSPDVIVKESKRILNNHLSIRNFNSLFNIRKNIK